MKQKESFVNRILLLVCLTAFLMGICLSAVGALMIYEQTENSIKAEITQAANSLERLYDTEYSGEYFAEGMVLSKGPSPLSELEFKDFCSYIAGKDIRFTIFWGDTRMLTTVQNYDGTYALGTKASDEVCEEVLVRGKDFYSNKITVNGEYYIGYYLPIKNSHADVTGMIFAGKPLAEATENAKKTIVVYALICFGILLIAVVLSSLYLNKMVRAINDMKHFMTKIAEGDFSSELNNETKKRRDEIGDISRHAESISHSLRDLIERDPLTSLLNRRSCRRMIDGLDDNYTIVMGDIDYFKKINDKYGHACGDIVLKEVSQLLNTAADSNGGFVSRWGGEEFLMVFPEKHIEDVRNIMETTLDRIRALEFHFEGSELSVTMTFGGFENLSGSEADDTINSADKLLYEGKQNGRNRIVM